MSRSYLLDTQVVLWIDEKPERFSSAVRVQLAQAKQLYYSAASAWEIAIKRSKGKLQLAVAFSEIALGLSLRELAITSVHTEAAGALPRHHQDPFDRLIVSQAIEEGLTLATADKLLKLYSSDVLLV